MILWSASAIQYSRRSVSSTGQRARSFYIYGRGACPFRCTWGASAQTCSVEQPQAKTLRFKTLHQAAALAKELGEERSELEQQAEPRFFTVLDMCCIAVFKSKPVELSECKVDA